MEIKGGTSAIELNGTTSDSCIYFQDNGSNKWLVYRDVSQANKFKIYNYNISASAIGFRYSDGKVIDFQGFDLGSPIEIAPAIYLVPQASAPASPSVGMLYVNSTDNHLYYYNGTAWVQLD